MTKINSKGICIVEISESYEDWGIKFANKAFCENIEGTIQEVVGQSIKALMPKCVEIVHGTFIKQYF
jgi:hypothetical protein